MGEADDGSAAADRTGASDPPPRSTNDKEPVTRMKRRQIGSVIPTALALALAAIVLAACGSSSSSTAVTRTAGPSTGAGTTTRSPKGGAPGALAGTPTAFRECMRTHGITLPQPKPGQPAGAAPPALPAGVTRADYEAALKKCSALRPRLPGGAGAPTGPGQRFRSPVFKAALLKFAACMRENGVALPAPNVTGRGPVFSTAGINTAGPRFRTAESKCAPQLRQGFSRPGAGAAPGAGRQTG